MPRPRWCLLLLLLGVARATPLRAEDPPGGAPPAVEDRSRLTVERVFGDKPLTAPLPDWSWRPGHAQLVRSVTREKRELLVALDPESGVETTLLDLTALEETALKEPAPGPGGAGEQGLGRGGPARFLWRPDGRALAVLVKGERVWVELAGEGRERLVARRLTSGGAPRSDAQLAPDGSVLSFEADGKVWWLSTSSGHARSALARTHPDVLLGTLDWLYPEELGIEHAAWWSPDSERLAVLELDEREVPTYPVPNSLDPETPSVVMRYPYAGQTNPKAALLVIAQHEPVGKPPVRLDLGTPAPEYVARVAWTPDSRRVLVVTLDRAQQTLALRSCDPLTGAGVTVYEEHDPAWVDPPPTPRFLGPRELLWQSALGDSVRWGRLRLDAEGTARIGDLEPLTPAGFVAGELLRAQAATGDGAAPPIVVEGCVPGERRRALWGPGVGSLGDALGACDGSASVALDATGTWALVRRSAVRTPSVLELRRVRDGAVVRTLGNALTPAFEALDLPEVEQGATELGDGARALWRLFKPAHLEAGKRVPLILTVYGGPGSRTVEDRFGGGLLWTTLLTHHGFAVLDVDGRGTGGQGPRHERLLRGRLGDVEFAGLPTVIQRLAADHAWLDASRVGIWGWSFGGTVVCDALTRRPDVFRCGVAVAPVTDWRLYDSIYTERYMGLPEQGKLDYLATSAVERVQQKEFRGGPCRLLLLHGLADDNVHPVNTLRLVEALLAADKTEFAWHLYANRGHGLGGAARDVHRRALEWFERHLKGR